MGDTEHSNPRGRRLADWRRFQMVAEKRAQTVWQSLRQAADELALKRDRQAALVAETVALNTQHLAERERHPPRTVREFELGAARRRWLAFDLQSERYYLDGLTEDCRVAERKAQRAWRRLVAIRKRRSVVESHHLRALRRATLRREQRAQSTVAVRPEAMRYG